MEETILLGLAIDAGLALRLQAKLEKTPPEYANLLAWRVVEKYKRMKEKDPGSPRTVATLALASLTLLAVGADAETVITQFEREGSVIPAGKSVSDFDAGEMMREVFETELGLDPETTDATVAARSLTVGWVKDIGNRREWQRMLPELASPVRRVTQSLHESYGGMNRASSGRKDPVYTRFMGRGQ